MTPTPPPPDIENLGFGQFWTQHQVDQGNLSFQISHKHGIGISFHPIIPLHYTPITLLSIVLFRGLLAINSHLELIVLLIRE